MAKFTVFRTLFLTFYAIVGVRLATITNYRIAELEELTEFTKNNNYVLIHFMDFKDANSRAYAEEFEKVMEAMGESYAPLIVATIDKNLREVTKEFNVRQFPTVKLSVNNNLIHYSGELLFNSVFTWLTNALTLSNLKYLNTEEEIERIKLADLCCLLVNPNGNEEQTRNLQAIAATFPDIKFYETMLSSPIEKLQVKFKNTFFVIRSFDTEPKIAGHDDVMPYGYLKWFVDTFRYPLLRQISKQAVLDVFKDPRPTLFYFYSVKRKETDKLIVDFAQKHGHEIRIFACELSAPGTIEIMQLFGSRFKDEWFAGIINFGSSVIQKYVKRMPNSSDLEDFLSDFNKGTLKRYYKSEQPLELTGASIRGISASQLDKSIMDTIGSVLLIAYAPNSRPSQEAMRILEKIAKIDRKPATLHVMKMNVVENEHHWLIVDRIPSLFLFWAGDKGVPKRFEDNFSLKNIVKFLEQHMGRNTWNEKQRSELLADDSL